MSSSGMSDHTYSAIGGLWLLMKTRYRESSYACASARAALISVA
jgi:hypothetical protein